MPVLCESCHTLPAVLKRPKNGVYICKQCFIDVFEYEVHCTITDNNLFQSNDTVAIGASGGKDSTVLAHIMYTLNQRYQYGLNLILLSVDEGISGYRDDSLECVKSNQLQYNIPLHIVSYQQLYGYTMDTIVQQIGQSNNCTYCGVFRRQALDRGAVYMKANKLVTGHNADDMAETVLMNMLRGDINRLGRSADIVTGNHTDNDTHTCDNNVNEDSGFAQLPRCKPFKYTYEKEIVLYAYHLKLLYFSTECIYSPFAYRGYAREYIKQLERMKPCAILDIIKSADSFHVITDQRKSVNKLANCTVCGYLASNKVCKACALLAGLRRSAARIQINQHTNTNDQIQSVPVQTQLEQHTSIHVNDW